MMAQLPQDVTLPLKTEAAPTGQVLLLVDADAESVRLVRKAFRLNPLVTRLIVVRTPEEGLEVLRQRGKHMRDPRPSMVLLDMNLPTGFAAAEEFIRTIKADRNLESVPVVAMGASNTEEEVSKVYSARANCYIDKPSDPTRYQEMVLTTCQFWLAVANWSSHSSLSAVAG